MERMVYAFHIAPGQEDDVRAAAADIRFAGEDFGRSRQTLGLTGISVWLQRTSQGHLVVLLVEGDVERYFASVRDEPGIDDWLREKILQWTGSEAETAAVYSFPQSEELFSWTGRDLAR